MRTLDPYAADLFFVPIFAIYGQAGNVGCPDVDVAVAAHHLQRTMPYFWQRHGGADHVFFATGDKGFCAMDTVGTQLAKNPIFVSHFGLLGGLGAMLPNAKLDKRAHTLEQQLKNGEWIFAPHKDVVVPAYVQAGEPRTAPPGCPILPRPEQLDKCTPRGINLSRGWRKLLVHAGGIFGWMNSGKRTVGPYSLGMRQRLFQEFGNASTSPEPRILITSTHMPDEIWEESKYCLAYASDSNPGLVDPRHRSATHTCEPCPLLDRPAGDGWGIRMAKSAALNCVPLIAQPYVVQGFEDLLPYERFSKRLEFDQVSRLPAMLRARGLSQMARRLLHIAPLRDQCVPPPHTEPSGSSHASPGQLRGAHTHGRNESPLQFAGLACCAHAT